DVSNDRSGSESEGTKLKRKAGAARRKKEESTHSTKLLKISCATGNPVRVLRGARQGGRWSRWAPEVGVRYDGLYRVVEYRAISDDGGESWDVATGDEINCIFK